MSIVNFKRKSPCVGICSATAQGDSVCIGCKRTFIEVRDWEQYTDKEKDKILERIENEKQ